MDNPNDQVTVSFTCSSHNALALMTLYQAITNADVATSAYTDHFNWLCDELARYVGGVAYSLQLDDKPQSKGLRALAEVGGYKPS